MTAYQTPSPALVLSWAEGLLQDAEAAAVRLPSSLVSVSGNAYLPYKINGALRALKVNNTGGGLVYCRAYKRPPLAGIRAHYGFETMTRDGALEYIRRRIAHLGFDPRVHDENRPW